MRGVIRKRDVLAHPLVTVRCFGWRVFLKALLAGRDRTFLSVLVDADVMDFRRARPGRILDRCVSLEASARDLYRKLGERFSGNLAARELFAALAAQEEEHADLLRVCGAAGENGRWKDGLLDRCLSALPDLERRMEEAAAAVDRIVTLTGALRLVLVVEGCEINRVFQDMIASCDCTFVRSLGSFREAIREHLEYIRSRVAEIDPALEEASRALGPVSGREIPVP